MAKNWFRFLLGRKEETTSSCDIEGPNRNVMNLLLRVILWENKRLTSLCFLGVNLFFCLCLLTEWRYYGILFGAALIFLLLELFHETMPQYFSILNYQRPDGQEQHQYPSDELVYCIKEVTRKARKGCNKLRDLRQNQPLLYLTIVSSFFVFVAIVAKTMSVFALSYMLCLSAFLLPLLYYHFVPNHLVSNFLNQQEASSSLADNSNEEEFLPNPEPEARKLLDIAANLHLIDFESNAKNPEESLNSLDFLPEAEIPSPQEVDRSDSDDSNLEIDFQVHHFNGNSPDEDDAARSRNARVNLSVFGAELVRAAAAAGDSTAASLGADLFLIAATARVNQHHANNEMSPSPPSSESSFEIIDSDELH